MRIDVYATCTKLPDNLICDCAAIMVDQLRASASIITAIKNGASQVIPTAEPGEAAMIAQQLGREVVLCGERGGLKLPGFTLGNSPLEFTRQAIRAKTVIMCTTNGTAAILNVKNAAKVFIGSMINCSAVARAAYDTGRNIIIQCAGTEGQFSIDDILAAGAIISTIRRYAPVDVTGNDLGLCAAMLYSDHIDKKLDLNTTKHYAHLKKLGFEDDLEYCFLEDTTDIVPTFRNGAVTADVPGVERRRI